MIHLDGSQGEGGGQMVRNALALSVLTGRPFRMTRIRANRPKPGLKAQHLRAIEALRVICGARATEVQTGSELLTFEPGPVKPGAYEFDIGTAGSIALLLQALLPPLLLANGPSELVLRGGTCGKWQPPVYYLREVLLPYLTDFGTVDVEIERHGYYPKGGGVVRVRIEPSVRRWQEAAQLGPLEITGRGALRRISGIAFAAEALQRPKVVERMVRSAREGLRGWECEVQIEAHYGPAYNPGAGIALWAEYEDPGTGALRRLGSDALGERGLPAEEVGMSAANRLSQALATEAPVDEHLADQLVPFLGLRPGSRLRTPYATGHFKSNVDITQRFLPVVFTEVEKDLFVTEKVEVKL